MHRAPESDPRDSTPDRLCEMKINDFRFDDVRGGAAPAPISTRRIINF